jgi:hypothetical protein
MKITRRQLRQIILEELDAGGVAKAVVKAAVPAAVNTAILDPIEAIFQGGKGAIETVKAKHATTLKFMQDVLVRALAMNLKRSKGDMSKDEIAKAHKAITSRDGGAIIGSIEAGFLNLDLDDLQDAYKDLKKSASAERVDFRSVESFLSDMREIA